MASAIGPAVVANSRERGGQRESAGVVRAQGAQRPSHGPADCRCGGEGAARPFPLLTEIFAGDAGGLMRASSPPARAIVTRQGRDADRRLGRSAAEIERGPLGDAPKARPRAHTIDNNANAYIFRRCPNRPSRCVSLAILTTF